MNPISKRTHVRGALGMLMLVSPLLLTSVASADADLTGDLPEVMAQAQPGEKIPVTVVLSNQMSRADVDAVAQLHVRKDHRRRAVVDALKAHAAATQGDLLASLAAMRDAGSVDADIRPLWISNVVCVKADVDAIQQLAQRDDVIRINWDRPVGEELFPIARPKGENDDVSRGANIECGVDIMNAPQVWDEYNITGSEIIVGVIDTGCCVTHPDLANQIWINPGEIAGNSIDDDNNGFVDDIYGWNFESNNANINDTNSHGTHVSGTVAGDGTNGETTGMAPDALIMTLKFWNNFSGESSVWQGTQYGVENGAHVLTASLGWPHGLNPDRATWRETVENAIAAGVVVLYAAGNEGSGNEPDNVRTPGDVPDVLTIGATNCSDGIAGFSSRGPVTWENVPPYNDWPLPPGKIKPSVSGPGVDTLSTSNNCSGYSFKSGTSMATPHLAGAVALMLEANPNLDHFGVKEILMETSLDLGPNGMDNTYGAGRADAYAAVTEALSQLNPSDLNGDAVVDVDDLLQLLSAWGSCGTFCPPYCVEDINQSCQVDVDDLLLLLSNWG